MIKEVILKKALPHEMTALQELCKKVYTLNFANHWENGGLEYYLEEQFGDKRLKSELLDQSIDYMIIFHRKIMVGFLKINYEVILKEINDTPICELEKMYIFPEFKGKGIGKMVIGNLIDKLKRKQKEILYLCVLETNEAAIYFYRKLGFQFHSKVRLMYADFKEELKGLDRMYFEVDNES